MRYFIRDVIQKILFFLKSHYLALIIFFVVGLMLVVPQFLAMHSSGRYNTKAPFLFQTDEDAYMTRIQEIVDGHYLVASPNFYEYKDAYFPVIFPVVEYWYAFPVILFNVGLSQVMIVNKFLLPFILCWLVYFLILKLTIKDSVRNGLSNKWCAILGSILVVLGYELVDYRYFLNIIFGSVQNLSMSVWTRPVNPIGGAIFLCSFFIILHKVVEGRKKWIIPGSVVLALMVGYFFTLAVAWSFVFSLILLLLFKKDWKPIKDIIYLFLLHFLFSFPVWYNALHLMTSAQGLKSSIKNGMYLTHNVVINKFVLFGTVLFLLVILFDWFKNKKIKEYFEGHWIFVVALLMSSWIVYTQQVITGRTIWIHHFVQYTIPIIFIILTVSVYNVFYHRYQYRKISVVILVCLLFVSFSCGIIYIKSFKYGLDGYKRYLSYTPLFDWLNVNTSKDCVVLTKEENHEEVGRAITAFTHCNVYLTNHVFFGVPEDRILHNFFVLLRLRGVDSLGVRDYIAKNRGEVLSYFFQDYDQSFGKIADKSYFELSEKLIFEYEKFYKADFLYEIKKYKADYLFTKEKLSLSLYKQLGEPELLFEENKNNLYFYSIK